MTARRRGKLSVARVHALSLLALENEQTFAFEREQLAQQLLDQLALVGAASDGLMEFLEGDASLAIGNRLHQPGEAFGRLSRRLYA